MNTKRLEAFSDGVYAILITIMVLDLKVPHNPTWHSYLEAYPIFLSYALSFVFVGLNWAAHHELFHVATNVNNKVIWMNMFNLFWLSLVPFVTAAMGENSFTSITVTIYAALMAILAVSYLLLVMILAQVHGTDSKFANAYKGHLKSYITIALNTSAAIIAFIGLPTVAFALLILLAIYWLFPNLRHQTSYTTTTK